MASRKRPAMLWYGGDWLKDPHLSMCSPATRGIWMDALCLMHENGESGSITGTIEGLSRACRCTPDELAFALKELELSGVCPPIVREKSAGRHETVTINNRRMVRESIERKSARERKIRERDRKRGGRSRTSHAIVTPPLSSSSSFTSSSPPVPPKGEPPPGEIPDLLKGLELFEADEDLVRRYPQLIERWTRNFPDLNLEIEIPAAHEYQLEKAPSKRNKSMARFVGNWLNNSVKYRDRDEAEGRGTASGRQKAADEDYYGGMGQKVPEST